MVKSAKEKMEPIQLLFPMFNNYRAPVEYIIKTIMNHYGDRNQWAFVVEMRMGTGYGGYWADRCVDLFAINCYPSKANHKIAFEIKTSRSDFLTEIRKPLKRHPALMISDQFYFAAPKGMLKPEEIPIEAGLIEIGVESKFCIKVAAPMREAYPPTWPLVAGIARRLNNAEREKHGRET